MDRDRFVIKIGCTGFPVAQSKVHSALSCVELAALAQKVPKRTTLEKWRAGAPDKFEFIVCASRSVSHDANRGFHAAPAASTIRRGRFHESADVRNGFSQTEIAATTLRSRIVLFSIPPQMTPHPDSIGRLHKFFGSVKRDERVFVWEPPANWPSSLVQQLSKELALVPVMNPLGGRPAHRAPLRYYRIGAEGRTRGVQRMTAPQLHALHAACDTPLSYVIFNNGPTAFEDAQKFAAIVAEARGLRV